MKKILITGKNSYIGNMFTQWSRQWPDDYQVDEISVHGEDWKQEDFRPYDVVFHVAGIAHVSTDPKMEEKYLQVNRDLTIEVAEKAKADGIGQFIFMSSIIVYGTQNEYIDKNTKPNPDNFYGESKLQAEEGILPLQDDEFNIVIIRPPMIYGKNSKGNYSLLSKIAQLTPVFPDYDNQRSMLHIDNLTEFIRIVIDNNDSGYFHPQNKELVTTSEMVRMIANYYNHKIWLTEIGNPLINTFSQVNIIKKVFGNLYYDESLSIYEYGKYQLNDFKKTIELSE